MVQNRHTLISAEKTSLISFLKTIWFNRKLIWVFAIRDLKVKYSQTIIGVSWTLLQPLTAAVIYTIFFGKILGWKAQGITYPLYVLSGLISWNYFSYIIYSGSNSIQDASSLIRKVNLPKSIFPLSKVLIALTELTLSLLTLFILCFFYNQTISWKVIFIPMIIFFNTTIPLSLVFFIASFSFKRKDIFHLLPYFVTFGIWLTPVFFTTNIIPQEYQIYLRLNPMSDVVTAWRWALFDFGQFQISWLISSFISCIFFIVSIYFFSRKEEQFVDYI